MDFHKTLYLSSIFWKSAGTFNLNLTRITGTLHEDVHTFVTIFFWIFSERDMFQTKFFRGNQNKFNDNNLFLKIICLWDNVVKYGRDRQATDDYGTCTLYAG